MTTYVKLGHLSAQMVRKKIKHIRLRILEPSHEVRVSIPEYMPIETAQALAMTKFDWLISRIADLQVGTHALAHLGNVASHCYAWGKRYRLSLLESDATSGVTIADDTLTVSYKAAMPPEIWNTILEDWYRSQLEIQLVPLRVKWECIMGITIGRICLQRMKTRWGSSNNATRTIRINVEMAKKPAVHLEYLLVHEMTHFFHNGHGAGFQSAMDNWIPEWRKLKHELDTFPRI